LEKKKINKQIFSGILWESITKFCIQIASWSSTIIVARLLDPSDYGIVAIAGIFTGLLIIISEFGLAQGLINAKNISNKDIDSIFWLSLILSLFLYALLFWAAPYIASYYDEPLLVEIIRVSGSMLIFASLKVVPVATLMRSLRFKYTAVTHMVAQAVNISTAITLAYNGFGPWALIYSVLASQVVQLIAFIPIYKRVPSLSFNVFGSNAIVLYGVKIVGARLLEYVTYESSTFIISSFMGQIKVGYFNMANTISRMPLDKIGSIFNGVTFPAVSKVQDNPQHVTEIYLNLLKYLLIFAIPVFFSIFIVADDLILFLLTDKWVPIIGILKILLLVNVFRMIGMLVPSVLNGMGYAGLVLKFRMVTAVVIPSALLVGINFGLEGAVLSLALIYPVLETYIAMVLCKKLNITVSQFLKIVLPPIGGGAVMISVALLIEGYLIDLDLLYRIFIVVLASGFSYLIFLYSYYRKQIPEIRKALLELIRN
jgi:O-antigen/teichoic acid export membrane protein